MSKHTPGPWFVFGNMHCVGAPHEANGTAGIAMCSMRLRTAEENEANARLISAAPEMYLITEATKELTETLTGLFDTCPKPERDILLSKLNEVRRICGEVIVKVEGMPVDDEEVTHRVHALKEDS